MNYRQSLKTCRILVAILLLNMVAPLVVQADDSSNYALICTSAGLIEVNIDSYSAVDADPLTADNTAYDTSQAHCVYCNLAEQPAFQATNLAQHSTPNSKINLFYQRFVEPISSKSLLRYVQLRAPPVYI